MNQNIMDIDGVETSLKKLEFLKKEQELIVDDIKNINLNEFYSNGFYQYYSGEIYKNLSSIISMINDDIIYINNKKEGYINTSNYTTGNFKNLEEENGQSFKR